MILKKGYPRHNRREQAARIVKKHSDLPSFWRDRYRDRMTEVIKLQMEVASLKTQLSEMNQEKQKHQQLKSKRPPLLLLQTSQTPPVDELQCK